MKQRIARPDDYVVFKCRFCNWGRRLAWTVLDMTSRGIPVCPDCDQEMIPVWGVKATELAKARANWNREN